MEKWNQERGMFVALALSISLVTYTLLIEANAGNVAIVSIGETAETSRVIVDETGQLVPVGSGYIAVGTFLLDEPAVSAAAAAGDYGAILSSFKQFGDAAGIINFDGIVEFDSSRPLFEGDGFVGNGIYAILGNTPAAAVAPETATSWIIYKADKVFEADNPVFGEIIDLTSPKPDNFLSGSIGCDVFHPNLDIVIPSLQLGVLTPGSHNCVPEPSVAGMIAIVIAILSIRRHRHE